MKQLSQIGLLFFLTSIQLVGQTFGDCLGALPICDSIYVEIISPDDPGDFEDELHEDCCIEEEENSIWYKFRVKQSGQLGFRILPSDEDFDYDWALFNITNKMCSDIATDFSLISSCNAAGSPGCRGDTGPDGTTVFNFQNANCGEFPPTLDSDGFSPFNALVDVQEGEVYALLILEFTNNITDGFVIDFTIADDVGIYDEERPSIVDGNLIFNGCLITGFTLEFSEGVVCNSFNINDLEISADGVALTADLSSTECQNSELSSFFLVTFDTPVPIESDIVVAINEDPFDLCLNPNIAIELTYPGVPLNDTLVISNITICEESVIITEDLLGIYSSILWSTGETSLSIEVPPGNYEALLMGDCGERLVQYTVESGQLDVDIIIPQGVCSEPVFLDAIETGEFDYILNGQLFDNIEDIPGLLAGNYELEVFNAYCDTTIFFDLELLEADLDISGQQLYEITAGDTINLEVLVEGNVEEFYWVFQGDTLCIGCNIIGVSPTIDSEYIVEAIDVNGCISTFEILIRVKGKYDIYSPNIFTPNNDGINDRFLIFGNQFLENIELLEIYDRWGELIFRGINISAGDLTQGWDGTFKNKQAGNGIYSYIARINFIDGFQQDVYGTVALVR